MFNGIVETTGLINQIQNQDNCKHFTIAPHIAFTDLNIGESISINGVCLTVTEFTPATFNVTAVPETLRLTNLSHLIEGNSVNLERAMQLSGRFSGHYVQGHVDAVGEILDFRSDGGNALLAKISIPENLAKYVVKKGYITLDGMSITVIDVGSHYFTVTFIPHTQEVTIIKREYQKGSYINIEVDVMSKYVEKLLEAKTDANTN